MVTNKKKIMVSVALFLFVLALSGLILNETLGSHRNLNELELGLKQIMLSHEISEDIVKTITSVQDYIFYSDQQYIEDFRRHSGLTIKHQLELYNLVNPSKKQGLEEIIELTKAYNWFVEKEVVPVINSGRYNENDVKLIQLRHKEFVRDLTGKADAFSVAGKNETEGQFKKEIIGKNIRLIFLLVSLMLALGFLIWEIFGISRTLLNRCVYLDKLSGRTKDVFIAVDRKGIVKDFNESAGELLGVFPELIIGKSLGEVPALFPHLQNIVLTLQDVIMQRQEFTGQRITCSTAVKKLELLADYFPVSVFNRPAGAVMVASRVEELKDKHVLLETLETERKRISIEIHDWIGRHLSTMIHTLDYVLRTDNGSGSGQWRDNLLALRAHCQNAAIEMRGIMNDIHPYLIDRAGLISALESYISTFEKLNNIKVYVYYQDRSLRVKKKDEIIIYRIIQEALTNVAKHGKSTEVDIEFTVSSDTLKIEISDNGGPTGDFVAGKGLWGMKERANLIGGDIVFSSGVSGFSAILTVPVLTGD